MKLDQPLQPLAGRLIDRGRLHTREQPGQLIGGPALALEINPAQVKVLKGANEGMRLGLLGIPAHPREHDPRRRPDTDVDDAAVVAMA